MAAERGNHGCCCCVFTTGEYKGGVQPGLKNLTDHCLEEWFWRSAAQAIQPGVSAVRLGAVTTPVALTILVGSARFRDTAENAADVLERDEELNVG